MGNYPVYPVFSDVGRNAAGEIVFEYVTIRYECMPPGGIVLWPFFLGFPEELDGFMGQVEDE